MEDAYASITISEETYQSVAAKISAAFDKRTADRDQEIADLQANRARLEAESDKLLAAHFADAIDLATLKRHQDRIRAGHDKHSSSARAFLHNSLQLLTDAQRMYASSDDGNRRLANQAFYTRLEITEDEELRPQLAEPFATITNEGRKPKREQATSADVACSRNEHWVEARGLEPLTSSLQSWRSTN